MASSRPSAMYKGGGLRGDGTIVGIRFTDEFFGKPFEEGKIKVTTGQNKGKTIDKPHTLNVDIQVQLDDADGPVLRTLKAAKDFEQWEVSDDGLSVTNIEDATRSLPQGTAWGKLLSSMVESGLPEDEFPEDELNYGFLVGKRFRFITKVDEERTAKYGQKAGRDGKSFDRSDLLVDLYYEQAAAQPAAKTAGKTVAGKPAGKSASRTNGSGKQANAVQEKAEKLLGVILGKQKTNEIAKSKLSMAVLREYQGVFGKEDGDREAVRNLIFTDEFLNQNNGWLYDEATEVVAQA